MESFETVDERATATFEVRGSEFLGHVAPAADQAAAEAFVAEVRAEYDDATHNVPAYRVPADSAGDAADPSADGAEPATSGSSDAGETFLREYADDDGEPSGSAGPPALNVLRQRDLRNLVVVVTRYYGGVNLGVGGLARAYSRATSEAIDAAGVVERRPRERFTVRVAYDDSGTVRSVLKSDDATFTADYAEDVTFAVTVPIDEAAPLRDRLRSVTSGRVDIE